MTKVMIIAEVGSVHDGSFGNALKLIDLAASLGVDAVKFQTHIASAETLPNAPMPPYFKGEPRFEYFERTSFSYKQWEQLRGRCVEKGVKFISSPFSVEAADLLLKIGIDYFKIASGEVTNLPMLERIAESRIPVILSSGMSNWNELDNAMNVIRSVHNEISILQCTSEYPCAYTNVGLNIMLEMKMRYGVDVGLSDHTLTNYASFAAVSLGATYIERHFTFSRHMYGSDAANSLEPDEMSDLIAGIRAISTILDSPVNKNQKAVDLTDMKRTFEKSIVAFVDIPVGTVLERGMLAFKKPGTGISPSQVGFFYGKRVIRDVAKDDILTYSDVVGE